MSCYLYGCPMRCNSVTTTDVFQCDCEYTCPNAQKQRVQITVSDKCVSLKYPLVSNKTITPLRTE